MPDKAPLVDTRNLSNAILACSGAIAGASAKTIVAPLERVKIIFQASHTMQYRWSNVWRTLLDIQKRDGLSGLWKGHIATLVRIMPYSATNFTVFDRLYRRLQDSPYITQHVPAMLIRFFSGSVSGAAAICVSYPADVLRSRLAVDVNGEYSSYSRAVKKIMHTQGIRGFYSGVGASLIGILPYAGTSFMCFETLKSYICQNKNHWSTLDKLACGAIAGLVAQTSTYPLEVVRRRMQVHGSNAFGGRGVFESMIYVARTEGVRNGLYKGVTMNWIKGPLAVAISFTVNDCIKEFMAKKED
ncbi:hypothetical protein FOZ63_023979 [Perkinsus olseni]|uniref:Uncharacterized protein n=2 Tax=Perkinsus olseni TaxID=32597 RepID=A0A7J6TI25_PEROL|nr:hypothetical protein FOZ60_006739 [Perkinsus olseni]KAF4744853.1 hypothetical protein FOZ63_023979 [Perkinsus olseni]